MGVSLVVLMPTGQYDPVRLINIWMAQKRVARKRPNWPIIRIFSAVDSSALFR
jgi:hypothetical protein